MLNGALIGCGFFAMNQLNAWRDIEREGGGARIVALCDRDPERLAAAATRFGIERTYPDAAEMMARETLDFVDIATTAPSHRGLVELAAANRLPVICQKPVAPTFDDAKAMVAACEAAGVPFMIHENFRWQSPLIAVREAIDGGAIGTPFWGRVSFRSGYDVYAGQPYLAEGERFILEDLGVHVLDTARFLFGDVAGVAARTNRVNPRVRGEDVATVLLSHENGATSIVDCSYSSRLEQELFPQALVEIDGSDGSIRLSANYRLAVTGKFGTEVRDVSPPLLPWAERPWHNVQESVLLIQRHWVDCLRSGKAPSTSGRDNLGTYALVEASYLSAATGKTVDPRTL
ncbi:Gfo/Idh/MocA family protein [Kumtagia ephedrae]|uniref:Oxidoreductase n=1 Tax=Kumtagia ephedrae TaxID=2116701 RepID=A0A2P7SLK6_9HYPH|nr:Gfo/Idh/MocA family oxidoreductase [Mesorhizobium ephedrae]PSJ63241.1 oxidoreductase [Mesorhizobium ephedrae]